MCWYSWDATSKLGCYEMETLESTEYKLEDYIITMQNPHMAKTKEDC